jgi:hypothetical protein
MPHREWTGTPHREWEILRTLRTVRAFYLDDLLPPRHAEDELDKLTQAAEELDAAGKVRILRVLGLSGSTVTIIYRPIDGVPDPITVRRLSGVSR